MATIVIPTSGTGSRLGKRTEYTNKSLLKVGDMYALTHILRLYPPTSKFIITLGHFGEHVQEYLSLAHPDLSITYAHVDRYEGKGTSLGYSLLQARHLLQTPFIFHCCDALCKSPPPPIEGWGLYVSSAPSADSYASITVSSDSTVKELHHKGSPLFDFVYTGIARIEDPLLFWNLLERLYQANPDNTSLSDVHVFRWLLEKGYPFSYKVLSDWYDTGTPDCYEKTLEAFPTTYSVLSKPDESLCFLETSVIKFFADKAICQKRIQRGLQLHPSAPKLLGWSDHFFKMEKIHGQTVEKCLEVNTVKKVLEWGWETLWSHQQTDSAYIDQCYEFYMKKTTTRLESLRLERDEALCVNGLYTGSWKDLLKRVDMGLLETDTFSYFHGDFIFENLLVEPSGSFRLIDWRQDFCGNLVYGDFCYDLAKLRHNLFFTHGNIISDLYTINYTDSTVYLDMKCNYSLIHQEDSIQSFCLEKGISYKKVQVLTALIWLNMAPLYEGKLQAFLFYLGKYTLARILMPSHMHPEDEQHPKADK